MRLVAIILALFVAFPNMGYALTSNCCSHVEVELDSCEDKLPDTHNGCQDANDDSKPCSGQCDCSCCMHTFLIKEEIKAQDRVEVTHTKTTPLSLGTSFRLGFYNLIWQPPQLG